MGFLGGILLATLPAPSPGGSCGAAPGPASALAIPTGCPVHQWGGIFRKKIEKTDFFYAPFDLFKEKSFHLLE